MIKKNYKILYTHDELLLRSEYMVVGKNCIDNFNEKKKMEFGFP
jgi:hypothetical protein